MRGSVWRCVVERFTPLRFSRQRVAMQAHLVAFSNFHCCSFKWCSCSFVAVALLHTFVAPFPYALSRNVNFQHRSCSSNAHSILFGRVGTCSSATCLRAATRSVPYTPAEAEQRLPFVLATPQRACSNYKCIHTYTE